MTRQSHSIRIHDRKTRIKDDTSLLRRLMATLFSLKELTEAGLQNGGVIQEDIERKQTNREGQCQGTFYQNSCTTSEVGH
ncbi:hypothetical protein AALP_AA8G347500 [Arabis alpina]|uniref:Uncharacterized protein n=1 Tax=Arabis alpina TaxID=50452 RepID=A0A087GBD5_ARAAL|nr:hypothetical protein AALP_AA8G347500 [Arabis alpina]